MPSLPCGHDPTLKAGNIAHCGVCHVLYKLQPARWVKLQTGLPNVPRGTQDPELDSRNRTATGAAG
jgi:hypothetical protein